MTRFGINSFPEAEPGLRSDTTRSQSLLFGIGFGPNLTPIRLGHSTLNTALGVPMLPVKVGAIARDLIGCLILRHALFYLHGGMMNRPAAIESIRWRNQLWAAATTAR
jgi:hypothetical protein